MSFSKALFATSFLLLPTGVLAHASIMPAKLQCEYRVNPFGIDAARPRLSWQDQSQERNQMQSAYQILVASNEALLRQNKGDYWDSGKVSSDNTNEIPYAGKALVSGARCFWKIKVWDQQGHASSWSMPAFWGMGLLDSKDWQGKWIGWDRSDQGEVFKGAQWVWYPEGEPASSAPVGTRYFRRSFDLPADVTLRKAIFTLTADNEFRLFVNGQQAGKGDDWTTPQTIDVTALLKPGKNVLAVEAKNVGDGPGAAGLIGHLTITPTVGTAISLGTGAEWKTANSSVTGWEKSDYDDNAWAPAKVLGDFGMGPWGQVGGQRLPARYLRREFALDKPVKQATVYMCGLGLSELYLNGRKVGDAVLSPALSQFNKRSFYTTLDVTSQLKTGKNAVGVVLGNGRYWAPRAPSIGFPKLILQLNIEYADGTKTQVTSDDNWKLTTAGPIRANNEYDGEEYDARMDLSGWAQPGFVATSWQPVQLVQPASPVLTAQIGEPIRVTAELRPKSMTNPKPGVYVYDLGQNIAGWCQLKVSGPAGTVVTLRHAETLQPDGNIYTANLRSAKATDTYTLKGAGIETYEPRFTYHGFRYVEVTGYPGKPGLNTIVGKVVHDAVPRVGEFSTSSPLINQIYSNLLWTIQDNYRSMPTDLPRDERQGWLGDRQEVSKGETYLFNVDPIYTQWLKDIQDAQGDDGNVPDVCPAYWSMYSAGTVWPSTYIIVPHMLYDQYGDVGILQEHYGTMKKWTDFMTQFLDHGIMPRNTYGDWCVPPKSLKEIQSSDPNAATDGALLSTAIFYHDLNLMARSARLLGKSSDAQHFDDLAAQLKTAFNARFYKPELGYYDNGTQTSCVLPLAFGMVPDEYRTKVLNHLVDKIMVESKGHLATGLVGGHYLMRVLSDNGRMDVAYKLLTQTTYPSWGYTVSKGATTMWELWNGDTAAPDMNSANIVMMIGDLNIWLNEYLAGIQSAPATPGFKKIVIKPGIVDGLEWAKDNFDSVHGPISTEWHHSPGKFDLRVNIPANTTATVYLPTKDAKSISENGRLLANNTGLKVVRMEADRAVLEVGSGSYHFTSNWN